MMRVARAMMRVARAMAMATAMKRAMATKETTWAMARAKRVAGK
jgi:hypothetical protein